MKEMKSSCVLCSIIDFSAYRTTSRTKNSMYNSTFANHSVIIIIYKNRCDEFTLILSYRNLTHRAGQVSCFCCCYCCY